MDKLNLKNILTAVRDMINRSRIAYKDYLGEETITKTNIIVEGTLVEEGRLTLKDSSVASFVIGESYDVTIDGVTEAMIAYGLSENSTGYRAPAHDDNIIALGNITDLSNLPPDGWVVAIGGGFAVCKTLGSYIGKSISISQTKTITEKHYDIKKLPDELLPNTVAKKTDVTAVKKLATNAQSTAETAQSTAETAQATADNAQFTANNAQTAADNAQTAADLKFQIRQHSESVSVEVGTLSAGSSKSFENLNIKNGSIVSVTTSGDLSGKALWTGAQTCQIYMQTSVGAHVGSLQINLNSNRKYTITNLSNAIRYADLVITYQKVEVPQRVYGPNYGAWLPPYMIAPCLYLTAPYSSVGSKLYCLTVDDSGIPSFTNTEDSTEVWTPSDVPTKTSQLENDSGFVNASALVAELANKQDKITSTNKLAYSLISGTPTIPTVPTNVSAFTNDAGYLTLATLPKYEGVVE